MFAFVGASCGHLCDSTAFLFSVLVKRSAEKQVSNVSSGTLTFNSVSRWTALIIAVLKHILFQNCNALPRSALITIFKS